ncbi:MAG TPA: hypothetical protein G4O05_08665 [Caldilineae bacterium]|nr:hypothetical protein [Caldilineae bacterium]
MDFTLLDAARLHEVTGRLQSARISARIYDSANEVHKMVAARRILREYEKSDVGRGD